MSGMGHNSPVIDDSTATMMVHSIAIRAQQMRQGKPLCEGALDGAALLGPQVNSIGPRQHALVER
jgi:hypothetical protein